MEPIFSDGISSLMAVTTCHHPHTGITKMKTLGFALIWGMALGAAPVLAQAPSDSMRLQGSWAMVSGAADGVDMPATFLTTMHRTLS